MGFLIDTCVWIDVERGALTPADVARFTGDEAVFISPVTIAELKFGAELAADAQIRERRLAALARLRFKPLLLIDADTGEVFKGWLPSLSRWGADHVSAFRISGLPARRFNIPIAFSPGTEPISGIFPDLILLLMRLPRVGNLEMH